MDDAREVVKNLILTKRPEFYQARLDLEDKSWVPALKDVTYHATNVELEALALVGYPIILSNGASSLLAQVVKDRIKECKRNTP